MRKEDLSAFDVHDAKDLILDWTGYRSIRVIYFHGWDGIGVAPVLRSLAHRPMKRDNPLLYFDRTIYIDCSAWKSEREMQRKIAHELNLDQEIMALFDRQDEDDDFNGVDDSARDVIPGVATEIHRSLSDNKFMIIFLNGSDNEIDVSRHGIFLAEFLSSIMIWAFKRRSLAMHSGYDEMALELRYTHLFLRCSSDNIGYFQDPAEALRNSEFRALLHEEAADIVAHYPCMRDINLRMITDCCLYSLFLQCSFHRVTRFNWAVHASMYWKCDGIMQEDIPREISNALDREIRWEYDTPYLEGIVNFLYSDHYLEVEEDDAHQNGPHRWVSITLEDEVSEDMQTELAMVSSLFLAFERYNYPSGLPNGLFNEGDKLRVLILSYCAFSFVSPPFHQCHRLRFLGLEGCKDDETPVVERKDCNSIWGWLHSLWVLDVRDTDWNEILSEEKLEHMQNLRELNMQGLRCWRYLRQLQSRLPHLQRLRIFKPMHQSEESTDISDSFVEKQNLEVLDLSGNKDMKNLPTSLSKASNLHVLILDGCDGLENVVLPSRLPSSLRSFSFDGYGPASHWTLGIELPPESSRPDHMSTIDKKGADTSKISLQGCIKLENLFLRGLPNLVELDLSGSGIKVLDLVNVPGIKRLFLLGCEHLCAIRWSSENYIRQLELELLCIDTRPGRVFGSTRPSYEQHKPFQVEVHAILADARLARSLWPVVEHDSCFSIHITSSAVDGGIVQIEAASKEMVGPSDKQHFVVAGRYDDVLTGIGDAAMESFPEPPNRPLDRHVEIVDGSRGLDGELLATTYRNLGMLMRLYCESLHVHDVSTKRSMPSGHWKRLRWCRVERCPHLDTIFPPDAEDFRHLETIWVSDLLMARSIVSKGKYRNLQLSSFECLQYLHLHSCPRLQFVLPVWVGIFPNLQTIHIIHCDDLRHVFVQDENYKFYVHNFGVEFPKLTTIRLHNLPMLREISEIRMRLPVLETISVRGCFGLRRLPAVGKGKRKPTVEIEKDVWDALEWDGLADHNPRCYEVRTSSYYYKRRHLRGTVLR